MTNKLKNSVLQSSNRTNAVCRSAFTLVELLVVLGVISLLMGILMPALARTRRCARSIVCQSNIRQLLLANQGYALENNDYYILAAFDLFDGFGGRNRWHGVRQSDGVHPDPEMNTFDPKKGPLKAYLDDGRVKRCPEIVRFAKDGAKNAFEAGCGGYGYNSIGVGSRTYKYGFNDKAMLSSMRIFEINNPSKTVMFTDTAYVQGYPNRYLIEYSFCESPYRIDRDSTGRIVQTHHPAPSIHFRHSGQASVAWCDGHISSEPFAFSTLGSDALTRFKVGWFGPDSNKLFAP